MAVRLSTRLVASAALASSDAAAVGYLMLANRPPYTTCPSLKVLLAERP